MAMVYSSKGLPQMELFSVVVDKPSGRSLDLYGSISLSSYDMPNQSIYKRKLEDPERFPSELESFSLLRCGAPQFIPRGEHYTFYVDLKHRVDDSDVSFDEELCRGKIYTGSEDHDGMKFNKLLNVRLEGKVCSVKFGFGFYETAAIARVTATLINVKMKKDIKVYGKVTSQTSVILDASKDLFNEKSEGSITVHCQDGSAVLQLPGSLVAAPLDSELTICAKLYVCLGKKVGKKDGRVLARGTAKFYVKAFGMSVGVISGIGCDIQVEVDWLYF